MEWLKLLSSDRYQQPSRPDVEQRSVFQRDGDRIVFSSAFRRLQDKTQVHPFATSDYVRKRLTHSLEVAVVGRSLGYWLGNRIGKADPSLLKTFPALPYDVAQIVNNACLAHDIGNPPFGHAGEDAIGNWFKSHGEGRILQGLDAHEKLDFERFEGNAQGFRLVTRLQQTVDKGGLRLTYATLGAFTKYPSTSLKAESSDSYIGCKKHGFFKEDFEQFKEVATTLGLVERGNSSWARHPLVFLVEAADDICYKIVDVEDGFKLGRLTFEEAEGCLVPLVSNDRKYRREEDLNSNIGWLRANAIGSLISAVEQSYEDNEESIMNGSFSDGLLDVSYAADLVKNAKKLVVDRVFNWERTIAAEIAGSEMITFVLDRAMNAVHNPGTKLNSLILKMIPGFEPHAEYVRKVHAVTDFVSGMTDSYLRSTFMKFSGHAI